MGEIMADTKPDRQKDQITKAGTEGETLLAAQKAVITKAVR